MGSDPSGLLFYGIYVPEGIEQFTVADKKFGLGEMNSAYLYHKGFKDIHPELRKYFGHQEASKEEIESYVREREKLLSDLRFSCDVSGYSENLRHFIYYNKSMLRSEWGDIHKIKYSDLWESLDLDRSLSQIDDDLEELCAILGIPFKFDDCGWYLTSLYL